MGCSPHRSGVWTFFGPNWEPAEPTPFAVNGGVYGLGLNLYLANGIAIVLVSVWNFWLSERFGWKCRAGIGP